MISNILAAIMCVIALAAGIYGWWMENGGSKKGGDKKDTKTEETERAKEDEKN